MCVKFVCIYRNWPSAATTTSYCGSSTTKVMVVLLTGPSKAALMVDTVSPCVSPCRLMPLTCRICCPFFRPRPDNAAEPSSCMRRHCIHYSKMHYTCIYMYIHVLYMYTCIYMYIALFPGRFVGGGKKLSHKSAWERG